ncbi:hypothetical protein F7Q99_10625 [Streptomyces kaniharaensis]|uniref:LppX_LprAFG lipoprotein n=1 Tax=Streptomyces kaniharaensis TaxID=212423 RepID=A0A6N7KRV4_9ACTN|nr:hypothetical protein [Streptomyces kaniharaensis]MQS12734.1 hypothetical protein [Streptomyces kaniharaensis]
MRAVRLASAAVTAAVLLAGLTACGSSAKSGNDAAKSGDAKAGDTKTGDAKPGDVAAGALAGDPKAALAAAVLVMQKAGNGKVAMIAPNGTKRPEGKGDADWKSPTAPAIDLASEEEGKKFRVRVLGTDTYLGGGDAQAAVMGGKHWVKVTPTNQMGAGFLVMGQMLNPVIQLTLASQGKPTKVGEETVDGVQTTHFRAVEDASVMVAGMPNLSPEQRQAAQKVLEEDGKNLTVDLWLNGKMELVQYKEFGDKAGEQKAVTVKYSGLGTAAKIEAPAATDLGSEADILKLLG